LQSSFAENRQLRDHLAKASQSNDLSMHVNAANRRTLDGQHDAT